MVEGIHEVSPVEVRVDSEHLTEDHLADVNELFRESGSLADPVWLPWVCQLRERSSGSAWWGGIGDARRIRREHVCVVDLARDPALHQGHVLMCRELNGLSAAVEPSERMVAGRNKNQAR